MYDRKIARNTRLQANLQHCNCYVSMYAMLSHAYKIKLSTIYIFFIKINTLVTILYNYIRHYT